MKHKPRPPKARRNPIFLAREWQDALESGAVPSRADLARKLGVSRARVTQVLRLLEMAPEVLDSVEAMGDPIFSTIVAERKLRAIVKLRPGEQKRRVAAMLGKAGSRLSVRPTTTGR
jgi:hypothetical protein